MKSDALKQYFQEKFENIRKIYLYNFKMMLYNVNISFCGGGIVKQKKSKSLFGKIVILSMVCLLACVFYHKYSGLKDYNNQINDLKKQITRQEEYSKELSEISKEYSSDEYIEKYARKLGLVKPNEKIFRNYNDKK